MNPEFFGLISGGLVFLSVIPYAIRTHQGLIEPNITTWSLWTIIGLSILFTYKSSGAEANVWPAVFGFTNPLLIALLACKHRGESTKPNNVDKTCIVIGLVSLVIWAITRQEQDLVRFALYMAIVADAVAAVPTINLVWQKPESDRPFAWGLFAIGYGLSMLAITEHTFANWALPLYMFFGAGSVAVVLARHRVKTNAPWKEWV